MMSGQEVKVYRRRCGWCGCEFWSARYTDLACCLDHDERLYLRTKKGKRVRRYGR